ncbi:thiamine pyrophosphate-binding protein [Aliikangiella sp. IMCC44632]
MAINSPQNKLLPPNSSTQLQLDNADLLVRYLSLLGVEFIFGVPGGAIEPLYNAVARQQQSNIQVVVARHETGAAFMAEGYARETGRIGVCCATTGPGATNLITGVASAYADNIPMLVITAQTPLPKFGRNALQESSCTAIDTIGMFRHCTRYNTLISHTEQLITKLGGAINAAYRAPTGPAHISIPADILRSPCATPNLTSVGTLIHQFKLTDTHALESLTEMISSAKRVALFLGKGCGSAIHSIMEFAELTRSPIITGPAGKRWVNGFHPLYRGVFGFAGHESAQLTINDKTIDLLIAVGTPITELGTAGWQSELLNERLVHVDCSVEHFSRSPMARLHVCGDIQSIFTHLSQEVRQGLKWGRTWELEDPVKNQFLALDKPSSDHGYQIRLDNPAACHSDAIPLKPQRIVTELARNLPSNFRIHIDAGNAWAWFTHYFHRASAKGFYHIAMGFGSMGWAIGAAIGNCFASKQPSVCVTGDGSYLMSGQEITVALQHQLPVIYIVFNDSELGMVKHGQKLGGAAQIGFELPLIDFAKIAQAMGVEGMVINTPQELTQIDWQRLGAKLAPTLIDIRIDANEVPPMGQRVKDLKQQTMTPGG